MVDSLGNGEFKQLTPIKNRGAVPTKPAIHGNYRINSIESLFHTNEEVVLFNTAGKRVLSLRGTSPVRLLPGIFVYRIGNSEQVQAWGRVLVR
jgi:hypothetical protein